MRDDPFGWIGQTLEGKVRIDAVVGEGGFGVVYRAQHLGFDAPVAVKFLRLPPTLNEAERAKFQRAFQAEGRLLHRLSKATSTIVQAHDVGVAVAPSGAWTPYLVLEWLDGRTLQEDLDERRDRGLGGHGIGGALQLLEPAVHALQIAHELGVAHRDVKPENLFRARIGDRLTLKILDFGIAKIMSDTDFLARAYAATGGSLRAFSPPYAAPEQFDPTIAATGPWTDIYALGLVFIEIASGKRAYIGNDATQLLLQAKDPARRPSLAALGASTNDAIEAVLQRALAVDPRNRYSSMDDFWSALRSAITSSASSVPSPSMRTLDPVPTARSPEPTVEMQPPSFSRTTSPQLDADRTVVVRSPQRNWERLAAIAMVAVGVVALGAYLLESKKHDLPDEEPARKPPHASASAETKSDQHDADVTSSPPEYAKSEGADPHIAVLPAEDVGLVEKHGGRDWGDRCWRHLKAGKLGWAKAECDKGAEVVTAAYKPSLLYNEGLLAKAAGDVATARSDFEDSLRLREIREVREALKALDDPAGPRVYAVCSCSFSNIDVIIEKDKPEAAAECCAIGVPSTQVGVTPRKPLKICPCLSPGCTSGATPAPSCLAHTYRDDCCAKKWK